MAFGLLYFRAWFPVGAVLMALVAGVVLSVTGAWMGEAAQDIRTRPRPSNGEVFVVFGTRLRIYRRRNR